jgi:hypothetical protein
MKKLIFSLLIFISYSVYAEWVLVVESNDGEAKIYVDPATIRREGTLLKYWTLTDLKVRNKFGDMSRRTREEIDCKKERYKRTSLTAFRDSMLGGVITGNHTNPDAEWIDIAPGTLDEAIMKYVCTKKL